MDDLDRQILDELQVNFPVCQRPYDVISERLGVSVEELWSRITSLMDLGTIRRIGASLDSRKLGYSSTLAAIRVCKDDIDKASDVVSGYHEVTHSYLRENDYNVWFTLIAESDERIVSILEEIRGALSLESDDVLNLPVERLFKLDARFKTSK